MRYGGPGPYQVLTHREVGDDERWQQRHNAQPRPVMFAINGEILDLQASSCEKLADFGPREESEVRAVEYT
jgi:hypothetical protein